MAFISAPIHSDLGKHFLFFIVDNNVDSAFEISSNQVRRNEETAEYKLLQMDLRD